MTFLGLAGVASLACFGCDGRFNSGICTMLFTSIVVSSSDDQPLGPPDDHISYIICAIPQIIAPGWLWGLSLYCLFEAAESRAECVWMIISSLLIIPLGLPILANINRRKLNPVSTPRIVAGLSWVAISTGSLFSKSRLGLTLDDYVFGLLGACPRLTATIGGAIMFVSVARLAQSHSQTASELASSKRLPTDTLIPMSFPPFWGLQGQTCLITWTAGLALCVGAIEDSWVRALLVSMSVAVVLTIGYLPPFSGRIFRRVFDDYVRLLCILHTCIVAFSCLYIFMIAQYFHSIQ